MKFGVLEVSNWFWNSGARSFNGDIVILLKIDTGVLFRRVVGYAKKFLLQIIVMFADNMALVLPSAVTTRGSAPSAAVILLTGVPTPRARSSPTPPAATPVGCDMATTRGSIIRGFMEGIVSAKRGCRRARVVPAVPKKESQHDRRDGTRPASPSDGKSRCRGSPLLTSQMRGEIGFTTYAQRSC